MISCQKEADNNEVLFDITCLDGGYTIVENCLDFPVTLSFGNYGNGSEMSFIIYELSPQDIKQLSNEVGNGQDPFFGSDYFSIDFGTYGILSRGEGEEQSPAWYRYLLSSYSNIEQGTEVETVNINGKEHQVAYTIWNYTFPIDKNLMKYLSGD